MGKRNRQYFFEKRGPRTGRAAAERELRSRMAPLRGLDPDRLASAIDGFRAGSLGPLARVVAEFETRDDTMSSCSRKMRAAAARCPHQVLLREGLGPGDRERAEAHRRALERLWANVRATDALARNQRGGFRLLLKQMMDAQSFGFAAHELVWRPRPDGSMDLTCVRVPLQFFESRTGALRYLRDPNLWEGEEMAEGEWMVTAGDGVGIAASIAAMGKRLSLQDWLLFSERCGQPGLHARTDAKQGSEQWEDLVAAVANFGREWGIVTDRSTDVDPVTLANGGTPPYPGLVERMDRAIAVLYRGSDLSTLSADGGSVGASQQGDEADILEQDACEMLSETLQEQIERPYIRYMFGDDAPLAYVQVSPVSRPDLDMEMRIDRHLVSLGVPLSRKEALERYQRSMAAADDPDDAALEEKTPPRDAPGGGFGLPNSSQEPRNAIAKPLQNARRGSDGDLPPSGKETRQNASETISRLAEALGADMAPARAELLKLLALPEAERPAAARELMGRLDDLMPADPAMAAVLAEEMAAAFAEGAGEVETQRHGDAEARSAEGAVLNYGTSEGAKKGWETRRGHGWTQAQYEEGRKTVDSLVAELDKRGPDGVSKAWTNTPKSLGALNEEVAADIARANPLMRVSAGAEQTVDADQLNHALRDHGVGAEHRPNHVPITKDDLRNIPDILSDYDEIVPGLGKADGKKQEGVVFRKRYPDGTVSCVEIDFFNRKTSERELKFQTMWKEKQ